MNYSFNFLFNFYYLEEIQLIFQILTINYFTIKFQAMISIYYCINISH